MFSINNYPIHDVNERCILPTKKRLTDNMVNKYQELYGDTSQYNTRFNDLGIPIFIVKDVAINHIENSDNRHEQDGVISDELFDRLFDNVEIKSKKKKQTTRKKRKGKK